ncbi:MAG: hypothetical protein PHG83_00885 [Patescibacteria group bacterium]|nr:hypothetical protein [Patescibacteria group bacterium]
MKEFIFTALLVFFSVAIADILWVFYIRRISQGKALSSAAFGSIIWLLSAFVVISYIKDLKQIIPATLGSFIGTYITVKYDTRLKK